MIRREFTSRCSQRGRGVAAGGESTAAGDAGDAPGMRDVLLGFRAAVLALLWRIDSSDRLPWT